MSTKLEHTVTIDNWLASLPNAQRKQVEAIAYNYAYEQLTPNQRKSVTFIKQYNRCNWTKNYHDSLARQHASYKKYVPFRPYSIRKIL